MFLSSIFLLGDYKLQRVLYWFVYLFFVFSSKRSDKLENSWKFGIQNSFFLIQCDKHLPYHYISMCTPNIFFIWEVCTYWVFLFWFLHEYFGSNKKNVQPLVQDPCKAQLWPPYSMLTFEWFHLCQKIMKNIFTKCITSFYIVLQAKYWVFPLWFLHEYFSSNRKMPNLLCKILAKLNYEPPPLHILCWLLNEYDFAKKLRKIILQMYR